MLFSDHEATAMMRLACHAIGSADGHAAIFVPEETASQNASSLRLLASTSDSAVVTALTQAAALSSDRLGSLLRRTQAPGGEPVVLLSTSVASDPAERFLVAVGCHPTLGAPGCDSAAAAVLCVVEANPRASPPSAKDMEALSLVAGLVAGALSSGAQRTRCDAPAPTPAVADADGTPHSAGGAGGPSDGSSGEGAAASAVSPAEAVNVEEVTATAAAYAGLVVSATVEMISVHCTTPEGKYLYVSPACKELLGWEPEEMLGKPANHFFPPEILAHSREVHDEVLDAVQQHQQVDRRPDCMQLRCKDGTYRWVQISTRLAKGCLVCVSRDDTTRHEVGPRTDPAPEPPAADLPSSALYAADPPSSAVTGGDTNPLGSMRRTPPPRL